MTDYTELKRLAGDATPGPWERGDGNEVSVSEEGDEAYWSWEVAGPAQLHGSGDQPDKDADFIVAANPAAVLALIAENERLKDQVRLAGISAEATVHDAIGRAANDYVLATLERDQLKAENEALKEKYEAARDRKNSITALQIENGALRDAAAVSAMRIKELDLLFGRYILAMRAAVIEDEHGKSETTGMDWIFNSLAGPGQLPPEDEKDAQAYFDREIVAVDNGMQEVLAFHDQRRSAKSKAVSHD